MCDQAYCEYVREHGSLMRCIDNLENKIKELERRIHDLEWEVK